MKEFPDLYDSSAISASHEEGFLEAFYADSTLSVYHAGKIEINTELKLSRTTLPLVTARSLVTSKQYSYACWLWEQLLRYSPSKLVTDTITELFKLYQRFPTERRLYLMHAIVLVQKAMHDGQGFQKPSQIDVYDDTKVLDTLNQYLRLSKAPIPTAYLDMHTKQGRANGFRMHSAKGLTQFVESGMTVCNEVPFAFRNIGYARIKECYVWAKLHLYKLG